MGDADRLARIYERIIWTRGMQGESYASPQYRKQLDAGYELIPQLSDDGTAALLSAMMGGAFRSGDKYEASVDPLREAVDGLKHAGLLADASYNASMLADSLTNLGRFDEAIAAIERATELGEQSGDPNAVLDAEIIRGSIAADRGELAEAMEYTRRGILGAEEHGNTFCNLAANFKLADQQLRLDQVDSAIAHLETSTGLAQFCNAGGYEALGQAWLAAARARAGDLRPEDFTAPLEAAIDAGSSSTEALVRLQRAIALAGDEQFELAATDFERSIELFEGYGGLPNLARARHAYGEALQSWGKIEDAKSHLLAANELFTTLGIRPDGPAGGE
jgi:tetratricopeptide (TPR) repeat protein